MMTGKSSPYHRYLVIFHLFVEQLTVVYISGLVLHPAVVFCPPSP